jgi:hypothetical protein
LGGGVNTVSRSNVRTSTAKRRLLKVPCPQSTARAVDHREKRQ